LQVAATARLTDVLNSHNTTPILSTYNYLEAANPTQLGNMNGVYEDAYAAALKVINCAVHVLVCAPVGVCFLVNVRAFSKARHAHVFRLQGKSWMRFYEVWLGHGADQDAAQVANAVLETAAGIPFVVRADPAHIHTLEYPACAFLIAQVNQVLFFDRSRLTPVRSIDCSFAL
jgi:hypothetical protein